ncbi:hypothetical protein [Actinomadura sp. HBU206391]|uniref:hypothetical protein n=1 Tax=Actinomadura sp. HBU206391 TaxID=2731692 RepID=UPI0016501742|nr:hypothetical protein [Actinomadura sp. HBU206391]MBC6457135.1 hypothetical protein [Actinomadura sp. HBU206391]
MPTKSIDAVSWRRLIALALGIALAALLVSIPRPALAGSLTVRSAAATTPGWTTQIEVNAASDSDITKITARLRLGDTADPFTTVEDFELVSGTATGGIWRTSQPVMLEMGVIHVDVDATDASGATVTRKVAGIIDRLGKTRFSEFTFSPSTVDIDRDTVTYAGRLVFEDRDGNEHGIPGAQLCLALNGACADYTTTDPDGRFSSPVRLYVRPDHRTNMVDSDASVSYHGARLYRPAESPRSRLKVLRQETRVSMSLSSRPEVIGDTVQVSGRLERKTAEGQWTGAANQDVDIYTYDSDLGYQARVATARTGSDGSYSQSVKVPQATQWVVYFRPEYLTGDGNWVFGPYLPSSQGTREVIYSEHRTSISGFKVSPNPVGKGAQITGSGLLTMQDATGAVVPLTNGRVELHFSRDRKNWSVAAEGRSGTEGQVSLRATAGSSGYWRLNYLPDYGDRDFGSVSVTAYAAVKYRTTISSFNAAPEPVKRGRTITVGGTLKRYVSSWGSWSGQWVYLYFQPRGSSTWTYMAVAKTDRYGKFRKGFKASRDGSWMAKYKGATSYLPGSSGSDYVDVR